MFNEDAEGYHNAVEDVGDDAVHLRAEGVVRRLVREAAGGEHADAGRPAVTAAGHRVQRTAVFGEQRPDGAVGGDAGVARGTENVARPHDPPAGGGSGGKCG